MLHSAKYPSTENVKFDVFLLFQLPSGKVLHWTTYVDEGLSVLSIKKSS